MICLHCVKLSCLFNIDYHYYYYRSISVIVATHSSFLDRSMSNIKKISRYYNSTANGIWTMNDPKLLIKPDTFSKGVIL